MRKFLLILGTAMLAGLVTTPSFSMGGARSTTAAPSDDPYAVAKRLIDNKQYADAIPQLETALKEHPGDADILNYLGYTHRMVGDFPASLDYYKQALAIAPGHKGAHEYLGELYLQMHDLPSAQKELDTLAGLCPAGCVEHDTLTKSIAAYQSGTLPATSGAY
jgi:tetratricopeptide (TPR) repeat protein